jgi:sugar phosphate isomerase/epimerase
MPRPVTLFTGQWADLTLEDMAAKAHSFGYDGIELACWGDHFDPVKALRDRKYCDGRWSILEKHKLNCWAISNHLVGQAVCDVIDARHKSILPPRVWGDGKRDGVRKRAAQEMIATAKAAAKLGVTVVNGFTGSSVWHKLYFFPPTSGAEIDEGFEDFAKRWTPILDAFAEAGVKFALEVHPTEIAYDIHTAKRAVEAVRGHPAFGFNFDPSHLIWQGIDPVKFIDAFAGRIYHVHVKDAIRRLDGVNSILASHLPFGDAKRGWDFRSPGRGEINFEEIIRALNRIGYDGPLSVEWEDVGMDREHGAREACALVRRLDFTPSGVAFDKAFEEKTA